MDALSSKSAESLIDNLDSIVRDTMTNHNVSIDDLIQVYPLWPNNSTGDILSPFSSLQFQHSCNLNMVSNKDIIKLISMGLLIEYYSSGAVADDGSSSLWKNVIIARTAQYVDEPRPTDIKYINNVTNSERSNIPSLVTVSYFSTTSTDGAESTVIDLSMTEDDNPSSQQMQGDRIVASTSKKTKHSKAKKSTAENKMEQRKSFRDIKEPTDPYLKALDQEVDRKQQQTSITTSSRRGNKPRKNSKTQKKYEGVADNVAYDDDDVDNYHLSFNSSADKPIYRIPVRDHLLTSSSSNYTIDNKTKYGVVGEPKDTMINVVSNK